MVKLSVQRSSLTDAIADVVMYFVWQDKKVFKRQCKELKHRTGAATLPLDKGMFTGKELETLWLYPERSRTKVLLLVGLGKAEKLTLEQLRRSASTAAKSAQKIKAKSVAIMEPDAAIMKESKELNGKMKDSWERIGLALGEGAALGVYKFHKYLTHPSENSSTLKSVFIVSEDRKRTREIAGGLHMAQVLNEATYFARDLANAPGNEIYPDSLARRAAASGRKSGFRVTVFNEKKIRQLKMGGLLGVAQGSSKPPRFIIMEYNKRKSRLPTIVLVGKGVTFDSGGISIKSAAGMAEMKMDMSGAAAVIATMQATARLHLRVHLVGLVPATENMLGSAALKPGDVLRHFNGKTSEVDNTDAEGRLILADALGYAAKFKPDAVIDLATLTGACVVALGHYATGMMGNSQELMEKLKESGERTYERVWQLPMFEEYEKLVKSDIADVKNIGGKGAGAITAAMFLKKFIGDYPWVHLDIAGTAILDEASAYIPKGGSGVGVRLLVDFLRHWKN
jgi:leucyl aminopeptidase